VDCTADAILQFDMEFREGILRIDGGLADVTDCGRLYHVTNGEAFNGLVLWGTASTVGAADWLGVSPTMLVAAIVPSFESHVGCCMDGTAID